MFLTDNDGIVNLCIDKKNFFFNTLKFALININSKE